MVAKKMSLYLARVSTFSTVFLGINTLIFALFLTSTPLLAAMRVKVNFVQNDASCSNKKKQPPSRMAVYLISHV